MYWLRGLLSGLRVFISRGLKSEFKIEILGLFDFRLIPIVAYGYPVINFWPMPFPILPKDGIGGLIIFRVV